VCTRVRASERVQGRIRRPKGVPGEGGARFRFDPYRRGEGPDGRIHSPTFPGSSGGGEWFVCLFRENGRAAAIGKNFIYMIEKCCPRTEERRASSRRSEEDAPSCCPILPLLPLLSYRESLSVSPIAELFYLFSAPQRAKAREGVAKSSVGRRLKSGGGF